MPCRCLIVHPLLPSSLVQSLRRVVQPKFGLHARIINDVLNAGPVICFLCEHPVDQITKLARVPILRYLPIVFVEDHGPQSVDVTLPNVWRLVGATFVDDTT